MIGLIGVCVALGGRHECDSEHLSGDVGSEVNPDAVGVAEVEAFAGEEICIGEVEDESDHFSLVKTNGSERVE